MNRNLIHLTILIFFQINLIVNCSADKKENTTPLLAGLMALISSPVESRLIKEDITAQTLENQTAYIPSQCYTKTETSSGAFNPCYTCHQESVRPNYWNDNNLQNSYMVPAAALKNPWTNLFKDRTADIASFSDNEMTSYVNENNYLSSDNKIRIAEILRLVPAGWDFNKDGKWSGYIPDCYFNFDSEGFDRDPSGNDTGWRAFAYYPFLGSFWPANGSTDDVLIRLPPEFRQDENGNYSREIYKINLAVVEALIKETDIPIDATDENIAGVDLDKNGSLGTAAFIKYDWNVPEKRYMYYAGLARKRLEEGKIHLAARLYPEGTEFLHSVRYIGTDGNTIEMAPRMKELRYAKKKSWLTYADFDNDAKTDYYEQLNQPDAVTQYLGNIEDGLENRAGWIYQGFIEDAEGELRPQTYEETVFCMGCHAKIGATVDNTFVFARKLNSASAYQKGWYHWTQKGLTGLPEPLRTDGQYEFTYYLQNNKAGDEFRSNTEIISKFINSDGSLKAAEIETLHNDITHLLNPSAERAIQLNKAYRVIVKEQSFRKGRDATATPPENVHAEVTQNAPTNVTEVSGNRIIP